MTVPGSKLVAVLVALGCVVVATIGLKLSDPDTSTVDSHGVVGRPVDIDGGRLTVTGVQSGSEVRIGTEDDADIARTRGLFLVIRMRLDAPGQAVNLGSATVEGGGRSYQPYSSFGITADAGYTSTADLIVEVDPAHLTGLSVGVRQLEIIHGLQSRALIALPITPANVEQWRRTAGQTVTAQQYQNQTVLS